MIDSELPEYNWDNFISLLNKLDTHDNKLLNESNKRLLDFLDVNIDLIIDDLSVQDNLNNFLKKTHLRNREQFFSSLLNYQHLDEGKYSKFILYMIKHEKMQDYFFEKNSLITNHATYMHSLVSIHSSIVLDFFDSLSEKNKNKLYSQEHELLIFNSNDKSIIGWMYKASNKYDINMDCINIINHGLSILKSQTPKHTDMYFNKFVSEIILNTVNYYKHKWENKDLNKELTSLILDNLTILGKGCKLKDNENIVEELFNLQRVLPNVYEKVISEVSENVKLEFNNYTKKSTEHKIYDDRNSKLLIKNYPLFLQKFNQYNLLHDLYKEDNLASKALFYLESKTNRKKDRKNIPFSIYIIETTNGEALKWYIENNKVEELMEVKYKGKNFLFATPLKETKEMLHMLSTAPDIFNKTVLNNKDNMKRLTDLNDSEINDILLFNKLQNKIEEKSNLVKKNKI